jgi:hypothetical protein
MVQPIEFSHLDDLALTLRDVLRHYKGELLDMRNKGVLPSLDGFNVLHHAGVELHISQRLINIFLVEEVLTK